ncbi:hypothetical protein DPEC_G00078770 [Dallia pectoralis]|uniref:Uncharacterized protein n=1 Tax=Dallia pectoralis TaxID=75939 RepID=A0ACC2H4D2_DALPE|nr:hypothetical protein DPEC_G00078770 [Dallia pectoralis]
MRHPYLYFQPDISDEILRVLGLVVLTSIILFLTLEVQSQGFRPIGCCLKANNACPTKPITECIIQEIGACKIAAHIFNSGGRRSCIKPGAKCLRNTLETLDKSGVKCVPLMGVRPKS